MLTDKDVKKIAGLAKLKLTDDEITHYTGELSKILGYMDKLSELDLSQVEATSHAVDVINVFREDKRVVSEVIKDVLASAPDADPPYFAVPKVI